MKITKSMIYRPTAESHELALVTDNNGDFYPAILAAVANLEKKIAKGIYNAEQATAAFFHITTAASAQYKKDFGYSFSVTERWTAAQDLRDEYIIA